MGGRGIHARSTTSVGRICFACYCLILQQTHTRPHILMLIAESSPHLCGIFRRGGQYSKA